MIMDAQLMFDDNVEHLTTEGSANVIDLSAARDIACGEPLYLVAQVDTAFTDGSSNSTMTLTLESDNDVAFGSPTTAIQTIGTFAALAAAGSRLVVPLQLAKIAEQYIRVKYTVANGDLSTGKFTVYLVKDVQAWTAYADGITVS